MNKPVVVSYLGERFPLCSLTPAVVERLRTIAADLQSGHCPLEEIFASLGDLLSPAVRDRLYPQYEKAVCDDFVALWMTACDGALYEMRQRRQSYLRRLKKLRRKRCRL